MLHEEQSVGNYTKDCFQELARRQILILLEDLNKKKGYKEETLFVAANIVDRYINILTI